MRRFARFSIAFAWCRAAKVPPGAHRRQAWLTAVLQRAISAVETYVDWRGSAAEPKDRWPPEVGPHLDDIASDTWNSAWQSVKFPLIARFGPWSHAEADLRKIADNHMRTVLKKVRARGDESLDAINRTHGHGSSPVREYADPRAGDAFDAILNLAHRRQTGPDCLYRREDWEATVRERLCRCPRHPGDEPDRDVLLLELQAQLRAHPDPPRRIDEEIARIIDGNSLFDPDTPSSERQNRIDAVRKALATAQTRRLFVELDLGLACYPAYPSLVEALSARCRHADREPMARLARVIAAYPEVRARQRPVRDRHVVTAVAARLYPGVMMPLQPPADLCRRCATRARREREYVLDQVRRDLEAHRRAFIAFWVTDAEPGPDPSFEPPARPRSN